MEFATSNYDIDFPVLSKPNPHVFLQESLCVFYFHVSRTRDINMVLKIGKYFETLLEYIRDHMKKHGHFEYLFYLASLYKMIGQTRDIVNGKGERDFSYMMVCVFFKIFPELGHNAVKLLLESDYGCWSDFKYFCHFVLEHYPRCADLICTAIDIAIYNFDKDRYNWENAIMKYLKCVYGEPKKQFVRPDGRKHMSLIAKWMPREGSRFHWIYERVVSKWHVIHSPFLFENIRDTEHYEKIMRKCKTDFRQMLSAMNRELDTVQIKQCEKRMGDIYPEKVPLQCILKNINCFTDKDKDKCVDTNYDADGFKNFLYFGEPNYKNHVHNNKTTHLSVGYFVKQARHLLKQVFTEKVMCQMRFLERSWKENVIKAFKFDGVKRKCQNMLPIVDISFDLDMDAQNTSIGMGILIAQLSPLHRIICTEHNMITLEVNASNDVSKGFIDIVREIESIMNNSMLFDLTNTMRTLGGAKYLIRDYTYLIILSSNANLYEFLNSEENCFDICQTIFWNVGTCTFDYEIINFDITHNVLYLSGTLPVLLHELQQESLKCSHMKNQYLTVSHILNASKYDSFGSSVYNYFLKSSCLEYNTY